MSRSLLKLFLASRVKRSLLPESPQLTWVHACSAAKSCSTLCDPMDCSPPGSSVHGIFQARILDWVAISSSRGSALPRDRICVSGGRQILYRLSYLGSCCLIGAPIQNKFKSEKKIEKKTRKKKMQVLL